MRLPGVQGKYVHPELRGLCVTLRHQRPGWVRGVGRLFIHGHIKQDSLSVGYLWGACQTFPYTASVSSHTHTLAVQLKFPAVSFGSPDSSHCVLQSHSHTPAADALSASPQARITPRRWSDNMCLLTGVRVCDRVES